MHSTDFGDYKATSLFQIVSNLDETTYNNNKEFDNICLQYDSQTTYSVKTPTSKTDYNSRY